MGHIGDGFLQVKSPNRQCQSTEGSNSPKDRRQTHQVHLSLTTLQSYTHACNNTYTQVVKVIWHKATSPPHMDGSVVFFRWCQCAPPYIESQKWLPWQRPSAPMDPHPTHDSYTAHPFCIVYYCVLYAWLLRFVTRWGGPGGIEAYP